MAGNKIEKIRAFYFCHNRDSRRLKQVFHIITVL